MTVKKIEVYPLAGYVEEMKWRTLIEYNTIIPEDAELVSLTAQTGQVDPCTYEASGPVKHQDHEYESLNRSLRIFQTCNEA